MRDLSTAAQEAKHPRRDLPFGILVSLALCSVLYIAVAVVLIGIVPYQQLNVADPIAVGVEATGLTWFTPVVKVSALFGLFSTMLMQRLGQTRIFFSMSRDGLLPGLFGQVHPRIFVLRRTAPNLERPFRTPGMPRVPVAYRRQHTMAMRDGRVPRTAPGD